MDFLFGMAELALVTLVVVHVLDVALDLAPVIGADPAAVAGGALLVHVRSAETVRVVLPGDDRESSAHALGTADVALPA